MVSYEMICSFLFVFLIAGILYNLFQHLRHFVHLIFNWFILKIHGLIVLNYCFIDSFISFFNFLLALFIRCINLSSKCLHLIHHARFILLACNLKSLLDILDESLPFFLWSHVWTNSSSENQESGEVLFIFLLFCTHQSFSLDNHFWFKHEGKSNESLHHFFIRFRNDSNDEIHKHHIQDEYSNNPDHYWKSYQLTLLDCKALKVKVSQWQSISQHEVIKVSKCIISTRPFLFVNYCKNNSKPTDK